MRETQGQRLAAESAKRRAPIHRVLRMKSRGSHAPSIFFAKFSSPGRAVGVGSQHADPETLAKAAHSRSDAHVVISGSEARRRLRVRLPKVFAVKPQDQYGNTEIVNLDQDVLAPPAVPDAGTRSKGTRLCPAERCCRRGDCSGPSAETAHGSRAPAEPDPSAGARPSHARR